MSSVIRSSASLFFLPFAFLSLSGCDLNIRPATKSPSAFTQTWDFDPAQTTSYAYNSNSIDFTGGVCRLKPASQTDNSSACSGFGDGITPSCGGSFSGVAWDATNRTIRLNTTTNNMEMDSSWTPQWSNLVGYWRLNGTSGNTIANGDPVSAVIGPSGIAVNAGTANNFTYSAGKLHEGISLGGSDADYVDLGTSAALKVGSPVTVSAWIKLNVNNVDQSIFESDGTNPNFAGYSLYIDSTGYLAGQYGSNTGTGSANFRRKISFGKVSTGVWHHVLMVIGAGGGGFSLNLDGWDAGGLISGTGGPMAYGVSKSATIGWRQVGSVKFNGIIDEVAVWPTILSPTEILSLYNHQTPKYSGTLTSRVMDAFSGQSWTTLSWTSTLPFLKELPSYASGSIQNESSSDYSALVGSAGAVGNNDLMSNIAVLYHFTGVSSTPAPVAVVDDSGNGNTGTNSGVWYWDERLGTAALFNGSASISLPNTGLTPFSSNFTINTWFNTTTDYSVTKGWIYGDQGTGSQQIQLSINNSNQLSFTVYGAATTTVQTAGAVNDGYWHLATAVRRGSTFELYLDGVLSSSVTDGTIGSIDTSNGGLPYLGRRSSSAGEVFSGELDEFGFWMRALDPKEIFQLYRRGANRVMYQVRVCTAADCSDDATGANWKGPDGTSKTYFSELNNNTVPLAMTGNVKTGLPSLLFSDFTSPIGTSRYFQYRALLESDDNSTGCNYGSGPTWCSPELKSVTVGPVHYDSNAPTVIGKTGVRYDSLSSFTETLGSSCTSGVGYNLGVGSTYSSATWYYWNGTTWTSANGSVSQSNSASTITSHVADFGSVVGTGTVYFKAFLKSSGTAVCELGNLDLSGIH